MLATQECIQLKKGWFKLRTAVGRDKLWFATSSNLVLQGSGYGGVGVTVDQRTGVTPSSESTSQVMRKWHLVMGKRGRTKSICTGRKRLSGGNCPSRGSHHCALGLQMSKNNGAWPGVLAYYRLVWISHLYTDQRGRMTYICSAASPNENCSVTQK